MQLDLRIFDVLNPISETVKLYLVPLAKHKTSKIGSLISQCLKKTN